MDSSVTISLISAMPLHSIIHRLPPVSTIIELVDSIM